MKFILILIRQPDKYFFLAGYLQAKLAASSILPPV